MEHQGRQPVASSQGTREDLDVPQREVKIATYRINKISWRSAPSGGMADEIPAALPLRISILML